MLVKMKGLKPQTSSLVQSDLEGSVSMWSERKGASEKARSQSASLSSTCQLSFRSIYLRKSESRALPTLCLAEE